MHGLKTTTDVNNSRFYETRFNRGMLCKYMASRQTHHTPNPPTNIVDLGGFEGLT